MKKYLGLSFAAMLVLAGCGSKAETYYGESKADAEGTVYNVEFSKKGDDITDVKFDASTPDYDSKVEFSESGKYGMGEKAGTAEWHEQVADLDKSVEENDKFPKTELNEEKQAHIVDGSSSATIHVEGFEEAFNNAKVK